MNEGLRNFLNTKKDGSNYTFKDMSLLDGNGANSGTWSCPVFFVGEIPNQKKSALIFIYNV